MIEVLLILGALALVAACGAFVAAEFSFVTVDRGTVDRAVEAGDRGARGVQSALRSLSTQLSSAQVGITRVVWFGGKPAALAAGFPPGINPAASTSDWRPSGSPRSARGFR